MDWKRLHGYKRENQTSARVQSIEPKETREIHACVYEYRIAPINDHGVPIAIDNADLTQMRKVRLCVRSEFVVDFY
jgi:hypothetical protein